MTSETTSDMTSGRIELNGFAARHQLRAQDRRSAMLAQLITSAALALSVAATAVSIGIARAGSTAASASDPGTPITMRLVSAR